MTPDHRAAYACTLENSIVANAALTIVYNDWPVSADRIRRNLRSFHAALDTMLYGRRFYKRPPIMRTRFWAVPEALAYYPHVHLGMQVADPDALVSCLDCELKLHFGNAAGYDMRHYERGWAGYAAKELRDGTEIVLSSELSAIVLH